MTVSNDTIRVIIPLTIRKRNGRPKILPPSHVHAQEAYDQHQHILVALGRAWAWRRRLGTGEFATIHDLAKAADITDRFVSRMMRLAHLAPDVLERLVITRAPPSASVKELIEATYLPWSVQLERVF